MSEIRTSLDFRQFIYVPLPRSPDILDFGQCLKSEQNCSDFEHFFLFEIQNFKNPNGTKSLDFRQKKKSMKFKHLCLDFGHFIIYIH